MQFEFGPQNFLKISFEKRRQLSENLLQKHPDYLPIIMLNSKPKTTKSFKKFKFICKRFYKFEDFLTLIRSSGHIESDKAIFFFCGHKLIQNKQFLSELYENNKHDDGFLYIHYMAESTFG